MDRKSIIVLVISFIVLMLWYPLVVNKLYPPKPLPPVTNQPPATAAATNLPTPTPPTLEPQAPARSPIASTNEPEQLLDLTSPDARYVFSSYGGGLKEVELLRYPETTSTLRKKQALTNRVATLNASAPVPALAVLGGEALQGDGIFKLSHLPSRAGVRAQKTLTNGLTVIKDFELSSNYLMTVSVRFENHSAKPLALPAQDWVVGTATPLGPEDDGMAVGVLWYNGVKSAEVGASFFSSRGFACVPRVPPTHYRAGESNVAWVAVHNRFFTLAALPEHPAQAVVVQKLFLPRPGHDGTQALANTPPPEGYEAAMVYPGATLAPNQSLERRFSLFAGPKEYQTLARHADTFKNNLDVVMNFGWSGFVSKALLLGMNWLHHILRLPYGWAIVVITVIIKLVFWPLTQASTRSMKRMQALQPQVKAIQEKYKDDPVKSQRKMMELWKEHKVSPMSGCLPMLIQIPVFFGFYQMIQSAIELRGAAWLWVGDLSKPDTLFDIPGTGFPFNLLPLIMGVTMLWQARLTPPSPGMDPAQAKIMRYMPLMFMVFLYNFSSGLTLYWTVQNLLTIAQTKLTRTTGEPAATPAPSKGPVLTSGPKKRK